MISIIVPLYNAAQYIEKTIETVTAQTYTDWELILVDDLSKDNSVETVKKCLAGLDKETAAKIRLIEKPVNEGAAMARNTGLDAATGRYIAFLDADDVWYPHKLEHELMFMNKHDAGFVCSSYQFGDENAVPTGKVVRVPKRLSYRKALTRTIIFTSTVLIDTDKVDKELIRMPNIGSEDTATWWNIMKSGVDIYGLDEQLVIYRRPATSLSSNKGKAVTRIWNLYRQVADLGPVGSAWHILLWAFNATSRRILDDGVRRHLESIKRFTVLQLSVFGLIMYTAVYAYAWFKVYYPIITSPFISKDGFYFGPGLKLYFKGHLLILFIYFVILWFMSVNNGSMRIGYLKTKQIAWTQIIALAITNIISFAQISLMRNWIVPPKALILCFIVQVVIALIWTALAGFIYRSVFAPRETLIIYGEDIEDASDIASQFENRSDRFKVMKTMSVDKGVNAVEAECSRWYGCVVLYGVYGSLRDEIVDFCYSHYIRVFVVPRVEDLLMRGFEKMDLWDTPILELKEYTVSWEMRLIKKFTDIFGALFLIIISSPILLIGLIRSKAGCGSAIHKDICMSKDGKTFVRHTLADGKFGWSLPMLWDILKGGLSLIGPEPIEEDYHKQLVEKNSRFIYRLRVKPGFTGYAKTYGKSFKNLPDRFDMDEAENILKLDMVYIDEYSIMQDLRLLFGMLDISSIGGRAHEAD